MSSVAVSWRGCRETEFSQWADFFLENYSEPPIRAQGTHEANQNALKSLRPVFGTVKIPNIDATQIEVHFRHRLQQKKHVHRKAGVAELGTVKPTTVHQDSGYYAGF